MELSDVRNVYIQIAALEDELEGYKREARRVKDDIKALHGALRRRVVLGDKQAELELAVTTAPDEGSAPERKKSAGK